MDNAAFAQLMTGAGFADPLADLWEIAATDTDPVGSEADPRMEKFCEQKMAATGDVLTGSVWWETAEAEDRQGTWWASDPQTDREDDTADRHDEWVEDWNRAARGHYRTDHPFPINPTDGEVDW